MHVYRPCRAQLEELAAAGTKSLIMHLVTRHLGVDAAGSARAMKHLWKRHHDGPGFAILYPDTARRLEFSETHEVFVGSPAGTAETVAATLVPFVSAAGSNLFLALYQAVQLHGGWGPGSSFADEIRVWVTIDPNADRQYTAHVSTWYVPAVGPEAEYARLCAVQQWQM